MNHPLNHFRFSLRALLRVIIILLFWMSALNELKCLKSVVRLIMTWMGSRCHMVNQLSGAPVFFSLLLPLSLHLFTFPTLNVRFIKLQDEEFVWLLNLQCVTNAQPSTDTDNKPERWRSNPMPLKKASCVLLKYSPPQFEQISHHVSKLELFLFFYWNLKI